MTPETAPAEAAAPAAPRRRWRALAWSVAGVLLALPALLVGGVVWLATTAAGTGWLLTQLPGLTVTAPQGSLLGDFAAERVLIALPASEDRIVIDELRWQGLTLARADAAHAWLRVQARSLRAARVELRIAPGPAQGAPQQLELPFELVLEAIDVGELHAPALLGEQPVRALHAALHLGADGGNVHRIDDLALTWDRLSAHGAGQIGSGAPLDVQATLDIAARATAAPGAPAFTASIAASGPLARLALQGTLRGAPVADAARKSLTAPPSLDAQATLTPFAAWPLAALDLSTKSLDLAALHSAAPTTAIEGTAAVQTSASNAPASIAIALVNARAGRIDEGLLPVRSLQADLQARPDDPARGEIRALDIVFGTAREAGGRVQGSGSWAPGEANVAARLSDLAPRVLDARAAALRVSGQATLDYRAGADASASPTVALRGRFSGSLPVEGRQQALTLDLDASGGAQRIEVRRAQLQAGATRASLEGRAARVRPDGADWRIDAKADLDDVDPAQWWAGPEGSAWRNGPHRIDATLSIDGLLPRTSAGTPLQQLARAQGRAELRIAEGSVLGGQPLAGALALRGGAAAAGAEIEGSLAVAGSALTLRGRLASDAADHWEVAARGADIAPWSALAALTSSSARAAPSAAGKVDADLVLDGRWPHVASRGSITVADARLGASARLARASARWTASTVTPQAPLDVQAEVQQLDLGTQKFDSLRLHVEGTTTAHRVTIDGATPARPPKWIDLLHGADSAPGTGTLAELSARGGLQFDPAWVQPLRWQGRLEKLQLKRAVPGAAQRGPWLAVAETSVDLQYDPLTRAPGVAIGPGRAALPNLALRWEALRWKGVPGSPQLELQAEIEPYAVAPLLARLQPEFGWGGDLVIAGRVNIRSTPTFVAEVEIGRQQGDLTITDERGPLALELTDLRLGLDAHDGTWHFTHALAGKSLGALAGAATVRTDARSFWPPAGAPLQGVTELQIANLAPWGAWAPPGWRLQGRVHASAAFGGTFGAPEFIGSVDGSELGLRNLLEGVDLRDGVLDIALTGERAQIRKLQASAGEGSVSVEGEALFGAAPQLGLRLVAERMRLLGRVDRRVVVSGDAALAFKADTAKLDGRFSIDEGFIDISRGTAPTLGDDVRVIRGPPPDEAAAAALPPGRRVVRSVDMNVRVDLGRALRLRGRGLDTLLRGDLLFTAPDAKLALTGTVSAVQGTYAAYNQKLQIERGTLVFSGPLDNPRLDILAVRPNLDVRVGVTITGSTRQPRIALFSDPDMSDNAKISWLVLGRPPEETGGGDTALLQAAAMAILAGDGDTPAAQLARLNPLDTFAVRQTDGAVRDTVLTVGKQLSQRWYIGYERTLSQTAGNWQLIYRLAQRITIRLQTGVDNSIDVIWSWRWD